MFVNQWLKNFERQVKIRRSIIINGNINDLSLDKNDLSDSFNNIISESLKCIGFKKVIFYNRFNGLKGINSNEWNNLLNSYVTFENNPDTENYDDFDIAEIDKETKTNNSNFIQNEIEPSDFFVVVQKILTQDIQKQEPIAFIVDYANYLFGQINSLTEMERKWAHQINNTIRDVHLPDCQDEYEKLKSIIIFLCPNNTNIPPNIYLSNPLFYQLTIPLPNPQEREKFILSKRFAFNLAEGILEQNSENLNELVTQTDGLLLKDIALLTELSKQQKEPLTLNNLISLYRFGKKESIWEKLNFNRIQEVKNILSNRVKGQSHAIDVIYKILVRAFTGLSGLEHSAKAKTPKGVLFFVGPTGVGKTELAKSLAQFLFGDDDACIRFDMSEFNHEHADQRLIGAPPGYVGFEEGGQLTNAIKAKPFSLILFDEIEKAHPRILDKFLQILEDGRLTDGKGETISFADTFIVFTSNIGASDIEPPSNENEILIVQEKFKDSVKDHFRKILKRPELLGRIGDGNILPFNFMTDDSVLSEIVITKLKPLENRLKEKWGIANIEFENKEQALNFIVRKVDKTNGGRGVLKILEKELFDPLANFLFDYTENKELLFNKKIIVIVKLNSYFDFDLV